MDEHLINPQPSNHNDIDAAAQAGPAVFSSPAASPAAPTPNVSSWSPPHLSDANPPQPPQSVMPAAPSSSNDKDISPMPVVQVLSTRGVEYTMLTLCLWLSSVALIGILLALFNGGTHFAVLAFPVSLLVVCLPVFGWLFLRLKKAELANPSLKLDPSKRRLTQFTQIIAFAACLFNVIAFVYLVFSKLAGQAGPSLVKDFLNLLVVLVVAGGVLAYYWNDEHRGN